MALSREPRYPVTNLPKGRDPGYLQIAKVLSAKIRAGDYQPGDKLPSERALAEQLGVSRVTTSRAIETLHHHGLVTRRQGSGTFVSMPALAAQSSGVAVGFTERMRVLGIEPQYRVLARDVVAATATVAATLAVPISSPVVRVRQLLMGNSQPMGLAEVFFPETSFRGMDKLDLTAGLPELVATHYGVRRASYEMAIAVRVASPEEAGLLKIKAGDPLMDLRWAEADKRGWTFTCGSTVYRDTAGAFLVDGTYDR